MLFLYWTSDSHIQEKRSLNKLKEGDTLWYTHKVVLEKDVNTARQLLMIIPKQERKVR